MIIPCFSIHIIPYKKKSPNHFFFLRLLVHVCYLLAYSLFFWINTLEDFNFFIINWLEWVNEMFRFVIALVTWYMKSSQISVGNLTCSAESLQMSDSTSWKMILSYINFHVCKSSSYKKTSSCTRRPQYSLKLYVSRIFFFFRSFAFFSTFFSSESTWEQVRGERELEGEREEVIEFHREVRFQSNKKAPEILH